MQDFQLSEGDVRLWIEQECIHLKVCDSFGDPVELRASEALQLAEKLQHYANYIKNREAKGSQP